MSNRKWIISACLAMASALVGLSGQLRAEEYKLIWVTLPNQGNRPVPAYVALQDTLPAPDGEAITAIPSAPDVAPPAPQPLTPPPPVQAWSPSQSKPLVQSKPPVQSVTPWQSKLPVQGGIVQSPLIYGKPVGGCCPKPREIIYRDHTKCPCKHGKCCCPPPIQTVLSVSDPCNPCGCEVQIPVCLPGTCTDIPRVGTHKGLLGRGYVTYRWCSGAKVEVVFCVNGDIIVHTFS